ncbi:hypothetical protein KUCAC02_011238 [Chaenocephalus aceratus]|uniref:Uncharacterized protein n=1 Tax=Chaenocephalus aceratus TaxID=36190 RepID=A0ACB9WWQ2_CHAAC|nr:hypothetical protein KUCAC02_011238 [Chaenocephalus aceratus]
MAAPVNIQTPSKSWELSLYELHRSPQEAVVDGTEVTVSPRSLHRDIRCPICLDMLKNTMTAKECLHRFCSDCIVTALRSGNKECPTCRQKLVSRRSLRRDSNFDALISKIYPSRDEYEAHQRSVLERLNRLHNKEALSSSIEEGLRQQARCRNHRRGEDNGDARSHLSHDSAPTPGQTPSAAGPSRKRPRASDEGPEADSGNPTPPPRHHKEGPASKIELMFKPHPELVRGRDYNQTRLLSTTVNATVDHISKYLALRIALDDRQTDAEMEDRGRTEGGGRRGEETGAAGGGAESGGRAGNGEGSALKTISEKHHTIYILTGGGQFSVSHPASTLHAVTRAEI